MLCKDAFKNCKDLAQINILYVEDVHYHNTKIIYSTNHQRWIILCQQNLEFTNMGNLGWKLGFHDVSRLSSNPYKTWALLLFYCSLRKWQSFTIGIGNSQLINNTFFPSFSQNLFPKVAKFHHQKRVNFFWKQKHRIWPGS